MAGFVSDLFTRTGGIVKSQINGLAKITSKISNSINAGTQKLQSKIAEFIKTLTSKPRSKKDYIEFVLEKSKGVWEFP